jgi:hypothetical protein
VIGVNLLVVSPYLYMLWVGYPMFVASPRLTIHPSSAHLLETTLRHGWVFPLALWGAVVAWRRGDRLSRAWVAQLVAAHAGWVAYLGLHWLQLARERDEIFYWTRFLTAGFAGQGAWDATGRLAAAMGSAGLTARLRAAGIALLALPWTFPAWWQPQRMDAYFAGSLQPIEPRLRDVTDFLRRSTDPRAVVAGDRHVAKYVAALGARRILLSPIFNAPPDYDGRVRLERLLATGADRADAAALRARYSVEYLLVTPAFLESYPGVTLAGLAGREDLHEVVNAGAGRERIVLYELAGSAAGTRAPAAEGRKTGQERPRQP